MFRTIFLIAALVASGPAFAGPHGGGGGWHGGGGGWHGGGHGGFHGGMHGLGGHGGGHWSGGRWIPWVAGGAAILGGGAAYCWRWNPYTGEREWVCDCCNAGPVMMPPFEYFRIFYGIVTIAVGFYALSFVSVFSAYLAHLNGW